MAILDPIKPKVLSVKVIPKVNKDLFTELRLKPEQISIGMITTTSDDALYAALDEGTKAANIEVVYARSFYAGADHASGPLSGEVIGIIAAIDPSEIESGMVAIIRYLEEKAWFYSADENNGTIFFPHVLPSLGYYLSKEIDVPPGSSLAYLIAPPIEAMYALDAALKAAEVKLKKFYSPPSETNFAGGLLSGELDECIAAASAFRDTVLKVAREPLGEYSELQTLQNYLRKQSISSRDNGPLRFILAHSGERIPEKPDHFTHLYGMQLVAKNHPRIELRGQIDNLQSEVLMAQSLAKYHNKEKLVDELEVILQFLRKLLCAEYKNEKVPELELFNLSQDELRLACHEPEQYVCAEVHHAVPSFEQGPVAISLNLLRTKVRLVELSAARTFITSAFTTTRPDILKGLNRLSSAIYVIYCREVAKIYDRGGDYGNKS